MENKKEICILCEKELDRFDMDICESCSRVMSNKYPKTKLLEEKIKCHKKHAKKLKR